MNVDEPRLVIRLLTLGLGVGTAWYALEIDLPKKLPSVALGSEWAYRAEVMLLLFYAGLLLLTPLFQGVIKGRLPTEITARGAKYDPDEITASLESVENRIGEVETLLEPTSGKLAELQAKVEELSGGESDETTTRA